MKTSPDGIVQIDGDNYAVTLLSQERLDEIEQQVTITGPRRIYLSEYIDPYFQLYSNMEPLGVVYPKDPAQDNFTNTSYNLYCPVLIPLTKTLDYDTSLLSQYQDGDLFAFAGFSVDGEPVHIARYAFTDRIPNIPGNVDDHAVLNFENTPRDKGYQMSWIFWKGLFVCIIPVVSAMPSTLLENNLLCRYRMSEANHLHRLSKLQF